MVPDVSRALYFTGPISQKFRELKKMEARQRTIATVEGPLDKDLKQIYDRVKEGGALYNCYSTEFVGIINNLL